MKEIKISNYAIYTDGEYDGGNYKFRRLYAGERVNVRFNEEGKFHFSIYSKESYGSIVKEYSENLRSITFDGETCTITCDFDKAPENKSQHSLTFKRYVYDDLRENIPEYMEECGCIFKASNNGEKFEMTF